MKTRFRRLLAALAAALLLCAPALSETDGFFSESGFFDYLSKPAILPLSPEQIAPHDGWIGVYYAPGVGLEVRVYENESAQGAYYADLYNYNITGASALMLMGAVARDEGGLLREENGRFSLRDLGGGNLEIELSEAYLAEAANFPGGVSIYGGATSATLTDVAVLTAGGGEDVWGGAYYQDVMRDLGGGAMVYDDLTIYLSLVRLYGTDDYYLVEQRVRFGQEMQDFWSARFLTESGGALIHEYGVSVVTGEPSAARFTPDADGNLTLEDGSDGAAARYIRCSSKPMWRE